MQEFSSLHCGFEKIQYCNEGLMKHIMYIVEEGTARMHTE